MPLRSQATICLVAVLGMAAGCGQDPTQKPADTGGDTATTDTSASITATTTTTHGASSDGDTDTGAREPNERGVHLVGRHDTDHSDAVRFSWSGTGAVVRFDGTGASVRLDDRAGFFTVVVDGQTQLLQTSPGEQMYVLATGLLPGEHIVELYRRTEGSFGPTTLYGFDIAGEVLEPPAVTRRMEIVGDSITNGYGNEGTEPCGFSADTQNHYLTYGAIAARAVDAELSTVAWSGKGLVFNYGDDRFEPMPQLYDRTLATDPEPWDHPVPTDIVLINLGTNDFSTDNDPSQAMFVGAYVDFLAHIRGVHRDAFIVALAPFLFGDEATTVAGYIQDAVDQRHAAGDPDVAFADINVPPIESGCDGHPSLATHAAMADLLVTELRTHMGW